jgi:putative ABC transport system permease protein
LVSVTERIAEFGLRKALGTPPSRLQRQVLLESVTLCLVAGVAGGLGGFAAYEGLIFAASKFVSNVQFEWVVEPWAVFISIGSIVGVGVASGILPAKKAEKLSVIAALRSQ